MEMEMIKISEKALERIIRRFNNKSMYIYIKGIITCRNTIHRAKCKYDITIGELTIYDRIREDNIIIDLSMAYQILLSKNKKILEIRLDNEQDIRIEL